MIKAKLFLSSLKKALELRVSQPWNRNNVPASVLPHIDSKMAFWDIIRKPFFMIVVAALFLPKARAPLDYLFESRCLRQFVWFFESHLAWKGWSRKKCGEDGGGGGLKGGREVFMERVGRGGYWETKSCGMWAQRRRPQSLLALTVNNGTQVPTPLLLTLPCCLFVFPIDYMGPFSPSLSVFSLFCQKRISENWVLQRSWY